MMQMDINYDYALGSGQGTSQVANNRFVIIHEIGVNNSPAVNNAIYMHNNWGNAYTTDIVGDGGKIYRIGEPGYVSWGAGSFANANAPAQIELARTYDRATFEKDMAAYIGLIRSYCDQFGIPKTLDAGGMYDAGVKTHKWVTDNIWGDHVDPVSSYLQPVWGVSNQTLSNWILNGYGGSGVNTKPEFNVVTINYYPGYGIDAVDADGNGIAGSRYKFKHGTQWKSLGIRIINNQAHYQLSDYEFVPQAFTDQQFICTINYAINYGIDSANSLGNGNVGTRSKFKTGTKWKADYIREIKGKLYYQVGPDDFIDADYTAGSGKTY
jgi:hypothetical protein